jgi:flagellar biosynthesis GTPase FlhF
MLENELKIGGNTIFRIYSAILKEEIILCTERNSLEKAIKLAEELKLILYTPSEINAMDGISPEDLPALHMAKKKLNAKIVASFKE